jgi:hypothetical protein
VGLGPGERLGRRELPLDPGHEGRRRAHLRPEATDRPVDREVFGGKGTIYGTGGGEHGMGSASSAVGNRFGTCPQCVLVFIEYTTQSSAERALTWANSQPWIDAVTNSYGFSAGIAVRDRVYNGTDVETEKKASERGQTTFFSSGNGPGERLHRPEQHADVLAGGPGLGRHRRGRLDRAASCSPAPASPPTSPASGTATRPPTSPPRQQRQAFSGRATPRRRSPGPTAARCGRPAARCPAPPARRPAAWSPRASPVACGAARKACELGDGRLTAAELRTRLFHGAQPTKGEFTDGVARAATTPPVADTRFAARVTVPTAACSTRTGRRLFGAR